MCLPPRIFISFAMISPCRTTLFSDIHGIAKLDYQLLDLQALFIFYVVIINLMKLSASNDISMIFQRTVEERNSKFPHFKTLLSLTCLNTNTLKFYSLLFNFIKFTIYYENYKEIPSLTERMLRVISILAVTNGHGFQPNISD